MTGNAPADAIAALAILAGLLTVIATAWIGTRWETRRDHAIEQRLYGSFPGSPYYQADGPEVRWCDHCGQDETEAEYRRRHPKRAPRNKPKPRVFPDDPWRDTP